MPPGGKEPQAALQVTYAVTSGWPEPPGITPLALSTLFSRRGQNLEPLARSTTWLRSDGLLHENEEAGALCNEAFARLRLAVPYDG